MVSAGPNVQLCMGAWEPQPPSRTFKALLVFSYVPFRLHMSRPGVGQLRWPLNHFGLKPRYPRLERVELPELGVFSRYQKPCSQALRRSLRSLRDTDLERASGGTKRRGLRLVSPATFDDSRPSRK